MSPSQLLPIDNYWQAATARRHGFTVDEDMLQQKKPLVGAVSRGLI